jgi:acetyl esterase/lipase
MAGLKIHLANRYVRLRIRRRLWGATEWAAIHRARRLLRAPWFLRLPFLDPLWLRRLFGTHDLRFKRIGKKKDSSEWVETEKPDRRVILYIHGGAYIAGSPRSHRPITAALARLTGCRVFSLHYRLAPEHCFPTALEDAAAAYRWLLDEEGLSASNIALAGDSAGGGVLLALILWARDNKLPPPACAVCFSPWTDLTVTGGSARFNDGRCHMFYRENLIECAEAYLKGKSPSDKYASPASAELEDFKEFPPLLLQVSSTELLLDDSRRVADKIKQAKGSDSLKIYYDVLNHWREIEEIKGMSRLEVYSDLFHCWQMLNGFLSEARVALRQAARFISNNI